MKVTTKRLTLVGEAWVNSIEGGAFVLDWWGLSFIFHGYFALNRLTIA
ncbi:hypothetical protein V0M98_37850 (plasmid) [Pseudomonas silesiensis]